MPINVFGNSSINSEQKIDTSLFVQKPYLRTNYIESDLQEDIDLKNQYRVKNQPDPTNLQDTCNKNYIDNLFNDPSLIKTNKDNDFGNYNLTNFNSITLNTQAENDNQVITKAYVDQFHQENERSGRDLGIDFYNESNDLVKNNQDNNFNDNKLTNLDSITINNNPSDDDHVTNKKYVDDQLDKNTIVRFIQTLQNYLKVSVGSDIYHLTKYNKIQLTNETVLKAPNSGSYLLPLWRIVCNDRNKNGKQNNFFKSTKTSSPTADSGATSLPPIGNAFMYIETSGNNNNQNNNGYNVFVTLQRTDIIQITIITFYYNRFSSSDDNLRAMGRFRIQLLLENDIWTTQYILSLKIVDIVLVQRNGLY